MYTWKWETVAYAPIMEPKWSVIASLTFAQQLNNQCLRSSKCSVHHRKHRRVTNPSLFRLTVVCILCTPFALQKVSSTLVVDIFIHHWILLYGIPNYVMTIKRPTLRQQNLIDAMFISRGKKMKSTPYHTPTSFLVERFNYILVKMAVPFWFLKWKELTPFYTDAHPCLYHINESSEGSGPFNVILRWERQSEITFDKLASSAGEMYRYMAHLDT